MSNDVSGFGLRLLVRASKTFPAGFPVTAFADDADPFDMPSQQIADTAMGLNGDLIVWSKANPMKPTINVIPNSVDDRNFAALFEANRPARGKVPARDKITIVATYPDGSVLTLSEGTITDGPAGSSVASAGRLKTNAYVFAFESVNRSNAQ